MSREAMKQALEALESDPISHTGIVSRKQAITALRQALVDADDTSQERVDETVKDEHGWVGLTDDEVAQAMYSADAIITGPMQFRFAKEIEDKLREKNHG